MAVGAAAVAVPLGVFARPLSERHPPLCFAAVVQAGDRGAGGHSLGGLRLFRVGGVAPLLQNRGGLTLAVMWWVAGTPLAVLAATAGGRPGHGAVSPAGRARGRGRPGAVDWWSPALALWLVSRRLCPGYPQRHQCLQRFADPGGDGLTHHRQRVGRRPAGRGPRAARGELRPGGQPGRNADAWSSPAATSGIAAAVILGVMRAIGETMVVWMASGNAAHIPASVWNFLQPVRTLTATIAGDMGEADQMTGSARFHVLFVMALCLLAISLVMNLLSQWAVSRTQQRLRGCEMLPTTRIVDLPSRAVAVGSMLLLAAPAVLFLAPIVCGGLRPSCSRNGRVSADDAGEVGAGPTRGDGGGDGPGRGRRQPLYAMLAAFQKELREGVSPGGGSTRRRLTSWKTLCTCCSGRRRTRRPPCPCSANATARPRWDRAWSRRERCSPGKNGTIPTPRRWAEETGAPGRGFPGTAVAPLFPTSESHLDEMLLPRWTFYWQFLIDNSFDAHFFGGIWPELLGTIYLAIGAMTVCHPAGRDLGDLSDRIFRRQGRMVRVLRTFINTLAGVPSIVFGLFGLAFFITTIHVSRSKSVLAGSMTLACWCCRWWSCAAEEAIRAVPQAYKEAALSLGASKWRTVVTVILPAALPGILTGIVISMGRAAGETAPIIFTAAVS